MTRRKKAVFNWSGGKDSALALYKVLQEETYEVVALLTTISKETQTSSIHAIPIELLEMQANSIGIPLYPVLFAHDMTDYESIMSNVVNHFIEEGVTHFIFGDIFLEDVKSRRESNLKPLGIEVVEPLWNKTSEEVMDEFIQSGIKSKIIVTQADKLDQSFIGKDLNRETIYSFPTGVDPCGENGEYHSFAYAGGPFRHPVFFSIETIEEILYTINLDNGSVNTFAYWQATIKPD